MQSNITIFTKTLFVKQSRKKGIKKALEKDSKKESDEDILVLKKLVKEDGTIHTLEDKNNENNIIENEDTNNKMEDKLNTIFDKHFKKWLDINMPDIINKYLNNKH